MWSEEKYRRGENAAVIVTTALLRGTQGSIVLGE